MDYWSINWNLTTIFTNELNCCKQYRCEQSRTIHTSSFLLYEWNSSWKFRKHMSTAAILPSVARGLQCPICVCAGACVCAPLVIGLTTGYINSLGGGGGGVLLTMPVRIECMHYTAMLPGTWDGCLFIYHNLLGCLFSVTGCRGNVLIMSVIAVFVVNMHFNSHLFLEFTKK